MDAALWQKLEVNHFLAFKIIQTPNICRRVSFLLSFHFLLPFLESGRFQSGRLLFRGNHLRQVERRPGLSVGQLEGVLSLPDGNHFPGGLRQNRIDTRVREDKSGRDFVSENDTQVYKTFVRLLPKGEDSVRLSVVEPEEKTRQ